MGRYLDVPEFFSNVYLVDLSPSLAKVARQRFKRLGWDNVRVVVADARNFRLEDYETDISGYQTPVSSPPSYFSKKRTGTIGADLITMSYSLSMIVCTRELSNQRPKMDC